MSIEQVFRSTGRRRAVAAAFLLLLLPATSEAGSSLRLNQPLPGGGDRAEGFICSPDSTQVAYVGDQRTPGNREVFVVPIGGGPLTLVSGSLVGTDSVYPGGSAFSPDMTRVLFFYGHPCSGSDLYSGSVAGGEPVLLAGRTSTGGIFAYDIGAYSFIDDGEKAIAFEADDTTNESGMELIRTPIGGGAYTRVNGPLGSGENVSGSVLSPTGDRFAYWIHGGARDGALVSVALSGGVETQLNVGVPQGSGWLPLFTQDGQTVVFKNSTSSSALYAVNSLGGTPVLLNQPASGYSSYLSDFLEIPTSGDIVYRANEDAEGTQSFYRVSRNGQGRVKLADAPSSVYGYSTSVSEDGNWLFCYMKSGTSGRHLRALSTAGGPVLDLSSQLPTSYWIQGYEVANSALGARAVYLAASQANLDYYLMDIYSANPATGEIVRLNLPEHSGPGYNMENRFEVTPDGRFVLYGFRDVTAWYSDSLFAVPVEGGEVVRVNGLDELGREIAWFSLTPDGSKVVYTIEGAPSTDVYELHVAGFPLAAVSAGTNVSGEVAGGVGFGGGVGFDFDNVTTAGILKGDYSRLDPANLPAELAGTIDFVVSGDTMQVWDMSFTGQFDGAVTLTFTYDAALVDPGFAEDDLALFRQTTGGGWEELVALSRDLVRNTIAVATDGFSRFALGAVPVPGDTNGDGRVDEADATKLAANWGQAGGWTDGDFNGDGVVGAADASILAANWGHGVSEAGTAVPEPAMLALLCSGLLLIGPLCRRGRRGG